MRQLLLCPPTYYGIFYEINPWMSLRRQADSVQAGRQWRRFYHTLQDKVHAELALLTPQPGLPDLVFTANAGLVYKNRFIPSRFRFPERAREEPFHRAWFEAQGFTITPLPKAAYFEGEGDALFLGDRLFGGYGFRSERQALEQVGELLEKEIVILELADPYFYHLDTCFCPISPSLALYYPPAFTPESRARLEREVAELIAVSEHDARRFACNAVVVGRDIVLNAGCDELRCQLLHRGFRVHEVDLSEFIKAGGSAKCLALFLDNGLHSTGEQGASHSAGTTAVQFKDEEYAVQQAGDQKAAAGSKPIGAAPGRPPFAHGNLQPCSFSALPL